MVGVTLTLKLHVSNVPPELVSVIPPVLPPPAKSGGFPKVMVLEPGGAVMVGVAAAQSAESRAGENVYSASGPTEDGRYLIVFFVHKADGTALTLSARDMTRAERRIYERK